MNNRLQQLLKEERMGPGTGTGTINENTLQGLVDLCESIPGHQKMCMVEIGAFLGVSTEVFSLHFASVNAVDVWGMDKSYDEANWAVEKLGSWEAVKAACVDRLKPYPQTLIFHDFSESVAKDFPDQSLDFVYIDGLHQRVSVDVLAWLPKIKTGGWIGGHDYQQCVRAGLNTIPGFDVHGLKVFSENSWLVRVQRPVPQVAAANSFARMSQIPQEIEECVAWLQERGGLNRVLEVGTNRGGTAALWCELAKDQVISIDLPGGIHGGIPEAECLARNAALKARYPQFTGILGDSHDPATKAAIQGPFDLLFIDGDHRYAGVRADYELYASLVRPGGVILFHDINDTLYHRFQPEGVVGVPLLWSRLGGEKHEFTARQEWAGLGALVVGPEGPSKVHDEWPAPNMKFRFHVLGLPQAGTTPAYSLCPFIPTTINFCRMMKDLGHTVFLYTSQENTAPCDEAIAVCTKAEQQAWLGSKHYYFASYEPTEPMWTITNARMIAEIGKRKRKGDFICIMAGRSQQLVAQGVPDLQTVEYLVGYVGSFSPYRSFVSNAWRQHTYGAQPESDIRFWDTTIPAYCDPDDFPLCRRKRGYVLYCGRMVPRKGIQIAIEASERAGVPLKLIGPGGPPAGMKGHCTFLGEVGNEERAKLMGEAIALLAPTMYNEPFGSTVIEANFCGTPAITTDWGAFTETIQQGVNGYRCNLLREFAAAIHQSAELDPAAIRAHAMSRYSLVAVAPLYQAYFERLVTRIFADGYYAP